MNRIRKYIFLLFLILQTSLTFAEVNCPPTSIVRSLQFLQAEGEVGIWDLFSKIFSYDKKNWQVVFTVYLPDAASSEEAMQKGEDFYQTEVVFFDHPMGNNENPQVCYYAQQESTYFVRAIAK